MNMTTPILSITARGFAALAFSMALITLNGCDEKPTQADKPHTKPNVLLVVFDDFGYNDLAVNNGSDSPTPTLDKIAQSGIRYTRHYAESSCTASRVALLTGLYPSKVGAQPVLAGIDHEFETLPDAMSGQGYTNYMIGKWHAGDAHPEARPEYQGFDHWFGFMNQLYLKGPHDMSAQGSDRYTRARPRYRNPWLENELGELRQFKGHLTDLLTDHAIEVMKTQEDEWFIYLSYYAPHTPVQPSKQYSDRYSQDDAGRYQALKDQLDTNLGRIYSFLEESGQLANTVIVIVSDNGGTAKSWPSNLPFQGKKATYTEGGVRTPLILSWADHWPDLQVRDHPAMIFDLYPTIVNAIGGSSPENLDGVDLLAAPADRVLRWYSHDRWCDKYGMLSQDGRWRLNTWESVTELLQNELDTVSKEQTNRLEEQPEIASQMRRSMREWIRNTTQVDNLDRSDKDGWRSYTGYGFRRTPIVDTQTMGFVFQRGSQSRAAQTKLSLVKQDGYIDISESQDMLNIKIDGTVVSIPAPDAKQQCFSLVVQSALVKKDMVFDKAMSLIRVYLNGELAGESSFRNTAFSKASPNNPLKVRLDSSKRWFMPPSAEVYISSRFLSVKEIKTSTDPLLKSVCTANPL